jgi:hypothetical protein
LSASCYLLILWIRSWFIGVRAFHADEEWAILQIPRFIHDALAQFNPFVWPSMGLCMAGPLVILIYEKRDLLSLFQRRLLMACAAIAAMTLVFGKINELRIFVPSLTILAYVAACAGRPTAGHSEKAAGAA